MLVYRVGNGTYARNLTGEGARLFGAQWNHMGATCLYTSSSRALAVLEFSVNVDLGRILRHLTITTFEIPEDNIQVLPLAQLPGDRRDAPAPPSTKNLGTHLLYGLEHLVLQIPSTVIREEFNYLVHPRHHRIGECKILDVKDFVYDLRIKTV
ncbi:MAG TPA: RES domain-containing protein [Flavisolibacter sp.]|nr:RES domain-containing protein [Flavisolibacter sp.]